MRIAIDTGGTFTDCVYLQDGVPKVLKLFSTPANPANAVVEGLRRIQPGVNPEVRHGTTVGTNAVLERKGARVAFVTTEGFEDTVVIGRQARANLYDWFATPPPPMVPAGLRFGVHERTCAEGNILQAPSDSELERLCAAIQASGAEAVAVSLLFAFANPASTKRMNMTLRLSRDDGRTWAVSKTIHAGPSAYSCLVELKGGAAGLLYERGERTPYERIAFERILAQALR